MTPSPGYRMGSVLIAIVVVVALLYYVGLALRQRRFARYLAGQMMMLFGWLIIVAPPILDAGASQAVWELCSALGFATVISGLVIGWRGRNEVASGDAHGAGSRVR